MDMTELGIGVAFEVGIAGGKMKLVSVVEVVAMGEKESVGESKEEGIAPGKGALLGVIGADVIGIGVERIRVH